MTNWVELIEQSKDFKKKCNYVSSGKSLKSNGYC